MDFEVRSDFCLHICHFFGLAEAVEDHLRTGCGQGPRDAQADSARGARYQRYLARKCLSGIDILRLDGDVHGSKPPGLGAALPLRGQFCRTGPMQRQCRLANGLIEFGYGNALRRNRGPCRSGILSNNGLSRGPWEQSYSGSLVEEDPTSVVKEVT